MSQKDYDPHKGFKRLARVLLERHKIDLTLEMERIRHGALKAAAALLGEKESTISNWKTQRGLPKSRIFEVAKEVNCDAYFLWGETEHIGAYGLPAGDPEQDRIAERLALIERKVGL